MMMSGLINPYSLAAGGIIGIFLLFRSGNGQAASSVGNVSPAIMSATVSMNTAALGAQTDMFAASVDYGKAQLSADTTRQANLLSYAENVNNNNTVLNNHRVDSEAGITNAIIASGTALALDINNNNARLGMGYMEVQKASIGADAQVAVARYQYKGVKAAANSSMIGNIVGSVAGLGKSAIGAFL